jgi:hypothetical protein
MMGALDKIDDAVVGGYGRIDDVWKEGAYYYWRDKGKSVREAADLALEAGMDYSDVGKLTKMMRQAGGFPTYPQKFLGLFIKTFDPVEMAKIGPVEAARRATTMIGVASAPFLAAQELMEKLTPEQKRQANLIMPKDEAWTSFPMVRDDGTVAIVDIGNMLPGGQAVQGLEAGVKGDAMRAAGKVTGFGGTAVSKLAAFVAQSLGKGIPTEEYTGKPLWNEGMTPIEKKQAGFNYIANTLVPAWLRNVAGPKQTKIGKVVTGVEKSPITDVPDRPLSVGERVMEITGPKVIRKSEEEAEIGIKGEVNSIKRDLVKNVLKNPEKEDEYTAIAEKKLSEVEKRMGMGDVTQETETQKLLRRYGLGKKSSRKQGESETQRLLKRYGLR